MRLRLLIVADGSGLGGDDLARTRQPAANQGGEFVSF